MKKAILTGVFGVFMLTGCATTSTAPDLPRTPPQEAMKACKALKPLTDDSMEALVEKLGEVGTQYKECASLHEELRKWVEDGRQ